MDKRAPDSLFWASLTAPLAYSLIASLIAIAFDGWSAAARPAPSPASGLQGGVFTVVMFMSVVGAIATIGGLIAFTAALVFAVPLLVLGRRLEIMSPFYFMLVGVVAASGFLVVLGGWTGPWYLTLQWAELSAAGALAGLVYWYRVHGPRRHDTAPETAS